MKFTAIIAEYNPFHNGHAYHIQKTRELCGETNIIVVMSGHFVQRGEAAVYDKWARAQMALCSGADVVIELPFLYATQSAEGFAGGAIRLIESLHCIDTLSFGSECADIDTLWQYARLLANEPAAYKNSLRRYLDTGVSYAEARAAALGEALPAQCDLQGSNNILAIEYLKALHRAGSRVRPVNIVRKGASYDDAALHEDFSSATAIRRELATHGLSERIKKNTPACCADLYASAQPPTDDNAYLRLLLYKLRTMPVSEMAAISDVGEGLEHRIKKAVQHAENLDELILKIKSKRYTYTRIKRILLNCLLDVTKEKAADALHKYPLYARILGFRQDSGALPELIKRASVPVITGQKEFIPSPLLTYDILATDVYSLLGANTRPASLDYTKKLIVV